MTPAKFARVPAIMTRLAARCTNLRSRRACALAVTWATLALAMVGCGYTKEEYQLQGDSLTRAVAKQKSAEARADEIVAELELSKQRLADVQEKMRALGIDLEAKDSRVSEMAATLAERERALAEYRARSARIDEIRGRLQLLRVKLADLAAVGVEVKVRKNRIAIIVPQAALFDSAKDKLKKEGKELLRTIAAVLKEDATLAMRDYQVAGHTDNKATKGVDPLVSTSGRARSVLGFLVDPAEGGLDRIHFSAAGYGDADPLASNDTEDGQARNRRVEIVLVPATGEMLDLRALAVEAAPTRKN